MSKIERDYVYIMLILILITINIFQILHLVQKQNELEVTKFENNEITGKASLLEQEVKHLGITRDILFSTEFIYNRHIKNSGTRIVSILPVNTCGSCLLTDSNILANLQNKFPNKFITYVLGDESFSSERYINQDLKYEHVNNINKLLHSSPGINLVVEYPIHILIDKEYTILNVHVTEFYNPDNTKVFLERLSGTL